MTLALPDAQSMRLSPSALKNRLTLKSVAQPDALEVHPLAGDASTRQYFRLKLDYAGGDAGPASLVVMQLEAPQLETPLEWLTIHGYLAGIGIPVPRVFDYCTEEGILVLEDLGDATLETCLQKASSEQTRVWYGKAVDLLAHLQARATAPEPTAFSRRFDVEKLMWEFDFMLEHYVGGCLGNRLSPDLAQTLRREMTDLCRELESIPTCYCHRDYHSRNLMVRGDELVMIDFQDARLGPPQYDLVSLLCDAYHPLSEEFVKMMKTRFLETRTRLGGPPLSPAEFERGFDLMTIQRSLKAVGTFAYQKVACGNSRYEPCIAPALAHVDRALARQPGLAVLATALKDALQRPGQKRALQ